MTRQALTAFTLAVALAFLLGASALAGKSPSEPPANQNHLIVGASENLLLDQPDKVVGLAAATNLDLLRINVYFQLSADHGVYANTPTDPQKLCGAAVAAANAGIDKLMLTFMPTNSYGYPQTSGQLTELNITIGSYLDALLNQSDGCINGQDGHPQLALLLQAGNEMNIDTFCAPQNDDDHRACAQEAAFVQASFYHFIKDVEVPKYGVELPVVGASVGSHHTPWVYMAQYKHKMDVLTQCVCMDIFDFHPYPVWGSNDQMSGFKMFPALKSAILQTFGIELPILYGEWAVQTQAPAGKGYINTEPWNPLVVPEAQQADIWSSALRYTLRQGVLGLVNEHVCDEQFLDTGFQSGMYYYDCTPKSSQPAISQAVRQALQARTKR